VSRSSSIDLVGAVEKVEVVPYRPAWPRLWRHERNRLLDAAADVLLNLEHIGSTAIPGLVAKPIIDMMGAIADGGQRPLLVGKLSELGYVVIPTGMTDRLVLRHTDAAAQLYQLHVVPLSTWPEQHERLMRDFLLRHRQRASDYAVLKVQLAAKHFTDPLAYTKAKTAFVQ